VTDTPKVNSRQFRALDAGDVLSALYHPCAQSNGRETLSIVIALERVAPR